MNLTEGGTDGKPPAIAHRRQSSHTPNDSKRSRLYSMLRKKTRQPLDPERLVTELVPTRAVFELRMYDFDAERYKYIPGFRKQCIVTSLDELKLLWALITAVIESDDNWKESNATAENHAPERTSLEAGPLNEGDSLGSSGHLGDE